VISTFAMMRVLLALTVALAEMPDLQSDFDEMDHDRAGLRKSDSEVREDISKFAEGLKKAKQLEASIKNHHKASSLLETSSWSIPENAEMKEEDERLADLKNRIASETAGFVQESKTMTPESILKGTPFGAAAHPSALIQEDPVLDESADAAKLSKLESVFDDAQSQFDTDRTSAVQNAAADRKLEGHGLSTSFLQTGPFDKVEEKLKTMTAHMKAQADRFRTDDQQDNTVKAALVKFADDDDNDDKAAAPASLLQTGTVDGIAELREAIKGLANLKPEFEKEAAKVDTDLQSASSLLQVDADTSSQITASSLLGEWETKIDSRQAKRAARHASLLPSDNLRIH